MVTDRKRRMTPEERERLRQEADARYRSGEFLTFEEFIAKHETKEETLRPRTETKEKT